MKDQRALQLFGEWMELSTAEQQTRLAQLRRDEPARADAVAVLLRADVDSAGILDGGVQALLEQVVDNDALAEPEQGVAADPAQPIGAFHLLRLLGRGGMGEVWLAQRRDGDFVQTVALKLLKRGMDSETLTARFIQERRILAGLNHPCIARFIDGGMSQDGRLYYAMEHVEGENLIDHADSRQLMLRERVRLMIEVCEAVAYAQSHLVVHRDLKPSNILVDGEGRPRVLDFGIAKVLQERGPDDTLTQTGLLALSPAYAAPEQVLGETISTATDVYALGVILFELLTGVLPQARKERTLEGLAAAIRQEHSIAPSQVLKHSDATTRGLHTARMQREIAGDLDIIVLTALRREPERRYRDAAALADDLRRWLESRPIAAQPDTRAYRLRKFVARNRLIVGSASGVLLALLTGLSVALWQVGVAREQASIAQAQTARAEREAASGRRITEFALSLVHELNPHSRANANARTPQQVLADSIQRVRNELGDDLEARAVMLNKLGMLVSVTGDLALAESAIQEALMIAQQLDARDLAMIQFNLAAIRMQQARNSEAEQLLESAVPKFADDPDGREYAAMAVSHLARIARGKDQLELALARLEKAQMLFTEAWGPDHGHTIELEGHRAILLFELGQYAAAQAAYRRTIERFERHLGADYPRLMTPLSGLARLQALQGNPQQALHNMERALAIGQAKMSRADPYYVRTEIDLVEMRCSNGDLVEAQGRLQGIDETSLKQRPTILGPLARARACLARASGAFDKELLFLQQAQVQAREANAADNIALAEVLSALALNAVSRAAFCESAALAESAQAMFSKLPNVRLIDRLRLIEAQAVLMARAGRVDDASEMLLNTVRQLEADIGSDSPKTEQMRVRLAQLQSTPRGAERCGIGTPDAELDKM
jgi:eukaryotic-like serine/threonine-protein kinase